MHFVSEILMKKGREVWCIAPEAKVYEALKLMNEKRVGALVVVDDGQVVGLFGEREHVRNVDLRGLSATTATVGEVMLQEVYCVTSKTSIEEAMAIVTESRCRHLPVIENEQLVGLVSIGDLVKASLEEKNFVIKQLNKYIKGEL